MADPNNTGLGPELTAFLESEAKRRVAPDDVLRDARWAMTQYRGHHSDAWAAAVHATYAARQPEINRLQDRVAALEFEVEGREAQRDEADDEAALMGRQITALIELCGRHEADGVIPVDEVYAVITTDPDGEKDR